MPTPTVPSPPRPTGDAAADTSATVDYMWALYRALVLSVDGPVQRLEAIGTVAPLATPAASATAIADPPTRSDVQALADAQQTLRAKLNEIVAAMRG
ncbi:hypothetical protein [Roseospira visakhapatnamensis]|uniref:Uncharacterized protein n=1 Tax=Roseospira visakhapatnamensis TaxID=390880 RepID=A0A7W6RDG0_9PROT|nr:hypothetical protein [Roseospira visakhapatnamensis]MBB4266295.1 hypothetical protein [Roseospira visakhapatnamensis]